MSATHEPEAVQVERDQSPTWFIRLGMALTGVVLLAVAIIAWRMRWGGGEFAMVLPWIVVLAVLLGAGAIIESIKTMVWVTLLAGIFVTLTAFVITGTYVVNLDASAHGVFVVDRYTGETHYCTANECRTLTEGVTATAIRQNVRNIAAQHKP